MMTAAKHLGRCGRFTRPFFAIAGCAVALAVTSMSAKPGLVSSTAPEQIGHRLLAGGGTTVFETSRDAFSQPAANLDPERQADFFVGNSFFNQNWVAAPASTSARDGLGPLFNTRSCSACHFKDGRGRPPEQGGQTVSLLLRISRLVDGAPAPDPVYGDQIQNHALPGVRPEAEVTVEYVEQEGTYADGEPYQLLRPTYRLTNWAYGEPAPGLLFSARVAPQMIGLGLLEAIPSDTILSMADPADRDGDGISGRANQVWDHRLRRPVLGRFGWKAEQPDVEQQTAAAFNGDMGLTTRLFRAPSHTALQPECDASPSGGDPEVDDDTLASVVLYSRTLAVPASRMTGDAALLRRGDELFAELRCATCHRTELRTGDYPLIPPLSGQTIHPYTDLLLHDMGPDLADDRPVFLASGSEWRTPPLWGLGLIPVVNGHQRLLHDGRARNVAEAILWHGGEAAENRERFRALPRADRDALVTFINSL